MWRGLKTKPSAPLPVAALLKVYSCHRAATVRERTASTSEDVLDAQLQSPRIAGLGRAHNLAERRRRRVGDDVVRVVGGQRRVVEGVQLFIIELDLLPV